MAKNWVGLGTSFQYFFGLHFAPLIFSDLVISSPSSVWIATYSSRQTTSCFWCSNFLTPWTGRGTFQHRRSFYSCILRRKSDFHFRNLLLLISAQSVTYMVMAFKDLQIFWKRLGTDRLLARPHLRPPPRQLWSLASFCKLEMLAAFEKQVTKK